MVSGPVLETTSSAHFAISFAFMPSQDWLADAINVRDHIHAFEHRLAVILHENRNDPLADETDHRVGIVVENHRLLQMQPLERGRHPDTEAKRTVLEHEELQDTRSCLIAALEGLSGRPARSRRTLTAIFSKERQ